jgi:hypothetical protein
MIINCQCCRILLQSLGFEVASNSGFFYWFPSVTFSICNACFVILNCCVTYFVVCVNLHLLRFHIWGAVL